MHYHLEIVMPPTDDVEEAVKKILTPFDENSDDEGSAKGHAFWDFYVIGGRSAGQKTMAKYDATKISEFYDWLKAEKVTVSGLQCGKQELSPASQIGKVDAKWNEMFPSPTFDPCPLFKHSNDQYGKGTKGAINGDISRLSDTPLSLKACHVIVAAPNYKGEIEAEFMIKDSAWNGCNYMPVKWDGTLGDALAQHAEKVKNYREDYQEKRTPKADWLVVTVDYHS